LDQEDADSDGLGDACDPGWFLYCLKLKKIKKALKSYRSLKK
jgi:hypothetical protein